MGTVPITIALQPGKETSIKLARNRGPYNVSMKCIHLEEVLSGSTNSNQMTSRNLNLFSGLAPQNSYVNGQLNFGINSPSNRGINGSSLKKEKTTKGSIMSVFRRKKVDSSNSAI